MSTPAIKAMMMPYSTAVAPDSSTQKFLIFSTLVVLHLFGVPFMESTNL